MDLLHTLSSTDLTYFSCTDWHHFALVSVQDVKGEDTHILGLSLGNQTPCAAWLCHLL